MQKNSINIGDVVTVDFAVFHSAGVDGTCHIEEDIQYVVMDSEGDEHFLALTREQEHKLDSSIASVLYSLTVSTENGVGSIENHPQVYSLKNIENG